MPSLEIASSVQRYAPLKSLECQATTLRDILELAFQKQPPLRGYVLDDQGAVRKHISIFVNDEAISDRVTLSDALNATDTVYVMQALSGG